ILSRDGQGRAMRPRVVLNGRFFAGSLSIAHTAHIAAAAWTTRPDLRLGIDAPPAELPRRLTSNLWLTTNELQWLRDDDSPSLPGILWSIKEAVYKAANRGEPFVPAAIRVECSAGHYKVHRDDARSHACRIEVTQLEAHAVALVIQP